MDNQEVVLEQKKISELESADPPKRFRASDIRFVYWSGGLFCPEVIGTLRICLETDNDMFFIDEKRENLFKIPKQEVHNSKYKEALVRACALCDPTKYGDLKKLNIITPFDAIRKRGFLHTYYEKCSNSACEFHASGTLLPKTLKELDPGALDLAYGSVKAVSSVLTPKELLKIAADTQTFAGIRATFTNERERMRNGKGEFDLSSVFSAAKTDTLPVSQPGSQAKLELNYQLTDKIPHKLRNFFGSFWRGYKYHAAALTGTTLGIAIAELIMQHTPGFAAATSLEKFMLHIVSVLAGFSCAGFPGLIIDTDERNTCGGG